jgi:hypothetical protein
MELIPDKTTHTVGSDVHDRSLIAQFIARDLQILRQITIIISQRGSVSRPVAISLERSYGRFKLWSDGYGVVAGGLDQPFEKSLILRRATWKLVKEISNIITESNYRICSNLLLLLYGLTSHETRTHAFGRFEYT